MWRVRTLCLATLALIMGGCPGFFPTGDTNNVDTPTLTVQIAGPSSVTVGQTCTLTASVDTSAVAPIRYSWLQIAGSGITLNTTHVSQTSFTTPSVENTFTARFLVTVTDSNGTVGRATVDVTIQADPNYVDPDEDPDVIAVPVARAGSDREEFAATLVELDGSRSSGIGLVYSWTQTAGTSITLSNGTKSTASFTAPDYAADGSNTYEFELTITDARSRVSKDRVTITISPTPTLLVETSLGNFKILMDPTNAPKTVKNVLAYVDAGFYSGTIFHRVEQGDDMKLIQGGGFDENLDKKATFDPVVLEAGVPNNRGTVGLARTGDPDSGTSQFYVNITDNNGFDPTQNPPGYAVFGEIIEGMDVVDAIGAVDVESRDGMNNVPVTNVVITNITRVN